MEEGTSQRNLSSLCLPATEPSQTSELQVEAVSRAVPTEAASFSRGPLLACARPVSSLAEFYKRFKLPLQATTDARSQYVEGNNLNDGLNTTSNGVSEGVPYDRTCIDNS